MTRAQIVKAAFRVLTLKLRQGTSATYYYQSHLRCHWFYVPDIKKWVADLVLNMRLSSIVYLSKRKEKDGTEIIGNIIHCKNYKSRLTKENKVVDVRLNLRQRFR